MKKLWKAEAYEITINDTNSLKNATEVLHPGFGSHLIWNEDSQNARPVFFLLCVLVSQTLTGQDVFWDRGAEEIWVNRVRNTEQVFPGRIKASLFNVLAICQRVTLLESCRNTCCRNMVKQFTPAQVWPVQLNGFHPFISLCHLICVMKQSNRWRGSSFTQVTLYGCRIESFYVQSQPSGHTHQSWGRAVNDRNCILLKLFRMGFNLLLIWTFKSPPSDSWPRFP